MIGAVVLAAGAGRRMGGVAKALLRTPRGESYLATIVACAAEARVTARDVVVVIGPPYGEAVAGEVARLGGEVVRNPAPERGMMSSVALGFAAMAAHAQVDAALLWPVDHPAVSPATLRILIERGEGVPAREGRGGHPPLVPRRLFAALAGGAEVAGGARTILRELPRIAVDDRGVIADVDQPADAARVWEPS